MLDIKEKFWSKVNKTKGCWFWTAGAFKGGYGHFHLLGGRSVAAHRYSYELHYGPIPKGLEICHSCDVPSCVNPYHLFPGSRTDNGRDAMKKRRLAYGEKNGNSKLTDMYVLQIRTLYDTGHYTQTELAQRFGVSHRQIGDIVHFKYWKVN